jgi:hypothetical protein
VDGARAAQEWLAAHDADVALAVIFLPMVPADDREAAVEEAGLLDDPRARCFWDGERVTGRTWGAAYVDSVLPQLLEQIAADAPWRESMERWDPEQQPLWDAGFFCAPNAAWPARWLPPAEAWCKQFAYSEGEPGANGFFRGEGAAVEVAWSSWREQFARGMEAARR